MRPLGRRGVLLGGAAIVTGCAAPAADPRSSRPPEVSTVPAPEVRSPAAGPVPGARATSVPWRPGPGEIQPEIKVAACRAVELLGRGEGRRTTVVYPQYGGLTVDEACVMVLADQEWDEGGAARRRELTVDVRLRRGRGASWSVTRLHGHGSGRWAAPGGMAAAILGESRLDIHGGAVDDLASGRVHPLVERILLRLSRHHDLSVSVFATGHPWEVFGTTGMSNHTAGRAVDIWAVDGRPVAAMPTDDPTLLELLRRAAALGSDEIGGPIDPDGPAGVHFANSLHRDHVHIGFDL
jgi:hypothetical protein